MTCIFTFPNWDKSDMSHPLPWAQATYFENRVCSGFRVSPCGRWPCFRITSISPIFHSIDINSAFQFRRGLYSSIQEAGCGSKGRCGTQEAHPWCGKGWGKEWAQETGQGQTSWQLGRPRRLTVFLGLAATTHPIRFNHFEFSVVKFCVFLGPKSKSVHIVKVCELGCALHFEVAI